MVDEGQPDATPSADTGVTLRVVTGGMPPRKDEAKTIEEMATQGEVIDPPPDPFKGTETQLSLVVEARDNSGFVVTRSIAKFKLPTSFKVEGQFQPGDEIVFELRGRVGGVHFDEIPDKYGNVIGGVRTHIVPVAKWTQK